MVERDQAAAAEANAPSQVSAQETKRTGGAAWPDRLLKKYDVSSYRHAETILRHDFPDIFHKLTDVLERFTFPYSFSIVGGGGKGPVARKFDQQLTALGFAEKRVDVVQIIDGRRFESPTHKVDFFRDRVAVELEWNNKTEFYDRDLDNFRKLHSLGFLSVGVIVTRVTSLNHVFAAIDQLLAQMPFEYHRTTGRQERVTAISGKYGQSTTHADKLYPKIEGGAGGQCPLLVFAMKEPVMFDDYTAAIRWAAAAGRTSVIPDDLPASLPLEATALDDPQT